MEPLLIRQPDNARGRQWFIDKHSLRQDSVGRGSKAVWFVFIYCDSFSERLLTGIGKYVSGTVSVLVLLFHCCYPSS